MEGIVEAIYTKERAHILDRLNLYIEKLRVLFRISHQRRYLSGRQYAHVSKLLNETGKMLGGWRKSLGRKPMSQDVICCMGNQGWRVFEVGK